MEKRKNVQSKIYKNKQTYYQKNVLYKWLKLQTLQSGILDFWIWAEISSTGPFPYNLLSILLVVQMQFHILKVFIIFQIWILYLHMLKILYLHLWNPCQLSRSSLGVTSWLFSNLLK